MIYYGNIILHLQMRINNIIDANGLYSDNIKTVFI